MANLKEIRTRIASVKSTRQITSAMKMVSASKLKKAQDAILNIRPYTEKLQDILSSVVSSLKTDIHNIYAQHREEDKILLVLITSDRGLCGAFNSNAIKTVILHALHNYSNQMMAGEVDFFTIGKKGYD
ncbi:MAG TPA: F0F1 ATP synthase subunit gamma, partial [Bacteroidaceae bacterium]|nr:F0F1 ATP synthase subunit gamma [Bacteroidaceae bacterium]